jgi:hypothetical protein
MYDVNSATAIHLELLADLYWIFTPIPGITWLVA